MIALTDCSPIVIAHEKGLFKKYGINSTVTKGANWAAIRDNLSSGTIQATHMLLGMPLASTMGLAGSPKKPMIIPWLLNRNGQAITLKTEWKGKVGADPKAIKPFVEQAKNLGEPLTFAMTFPPGTHALWMRYYLGAGGINPDKDVSLNRARFEVKQGYGIAGVAGSVDFRAHGVAGARLDTDNEFFTDKLRFRIGYTDKWWSLYGEGRSSFAVNDQRFAYFASPTPAGTVNRQGQGPESDTIDLHQAYGGHADRQWLRHQPQLQPLRGYRTRHHHRDRRDPPLAA